MTPTLAARWKVTSALIYWQRIQNHTVVKQTSRSNTHIHTKKNGKLVNRSKSGLIGPLGKHINVF